MERHVYVYGQDDAVLDFISARAPHMQRSAWPSSTVTMAIIDATGLIAGVAWHDYNSAYGVIHLSIAASTPKFGTKETLRRLYHHPFYQWNCQQVVHLTPADNKHVIDILKRLGCWKETLPRMFGRHRDGVALGLTKETWEARYVGPVRRHADAA